MPMRSFSLNSREFHDFVSPPPEPGVWAGGLPREPNFPRQTDTMSVRADDETEAVGAIKGWLGHVEAGRIGSRS